jgi:hypothetical protein
MKNDDSFIPLHISLPRNWDWPLPIPAGVCRSLLFPENTKNISESVHSVLLSMFGYVDNVAQFRYLGTTVTNLNLIQEEIKRRLNSGNACYHSVQNLLSCRLLSKNVKIRIYETIILTLVLYG